MPETREGDGAAYDRLSTPMEKLGREVMERLELRGDETILDAGCGSGRLTQLLIERVPDGRVIGVDASASMIDAARERLGAGADLRVADLVGLDLGGETVDVVFSTATLHWIAHHHALSPTLPPPPPPPPPRAPPPQPTPPASTSTPRRRSEASAESAQSAPHPQRAS